MAASDAECVSGCKLVQPLTDSLACEAVLIGFATGRKMKEYMLQGEHVQANTSIHPHICMSYGFFSEAH